MRCVIVLPGALLPAPIAADILREAQAPTLTRLLAEAGGSADMAIETDAADLIDGAAHLAWLWNAFSKQKSVPITAPYAHAALATPGSSGQWWHCDPCHFAVARDHMLAEPVADVAEVDLESLFQDARLRVGEWGATLERTGAHWFIRTEEDLHLEVAPLAAALGDSVDERMPREADAGRWRKLLTEIQISWHALPLNEARESLGLRAVNAAWVHGGGRWSALSPTRFAAVRSDDAAVRGWALAANVAADAVADVKVPLQPASGDALIVLDALFLAFKAQRWDAWLVALATLDSILDALRSNARASGVNEIEFIATGRRTARNILVRSEDRWRVWRRWRTPQLASWLSEAAPE